MVTFFSEWLVTHRSEQPSRASVLSLR